MASFFIFLDMGALSSKKQLNGHFMALRLLGSSRPLKVFNIRETTEDT
jgi:hypothetical protein